MTADIVSIASRRPGDAPDQEHVSSDQWGRAMFRYRGEYMQGGRRWTTEFWAFSRDDADELGERWGLENVGQIVEDGDY